MHLWNRRQIIDHLLDALIGIGDGAAGFSRCSVFDNAVVVTNIITDTCKSHDYRTVISLAIALDYYIVAVDHNDLFVKNLACGTDF